ncbi:DNA polymerase LigD, polymerase domain-containing protein [Desulforamulus profundi]|uniref:DNA polymerase LigD, polymerase domain-containing protein n=1 Tax=Desulforamulus profundi TaxID=1383067 RepID=A0A2C6M9H1_9FIRM|nr:non-homologous end-joining DNA ligase [Desulforamulus profundi]PHJ38957.1 DNA polymerase LigD, polymerase domain-containing protein [Desulforamulus profundi]
MATAVATEVTLEGKKIKLTNLNKLMWPEGLTKAHLVKYYTDIAPYLLPYIKGRPLVMKRYPHGIEGEYFYQKECPDYAPDWVQTVSVPHTDKRVNYIVCEDAATLVWLANQGCIEIHAWLSQKSNVEHPDIAIIDLDPGDQASFKDVMEVALVVHQALNHLRLKGYPKTSGASGIHIFIPLQPVHTFQEVTRAMGLVARLVAGTLPDKATVERSLEKREQNKVYVDYLQNTRGKSMAWTYSLRPLPGAPVSTPVPWEEIEHLALNPADFNMATIFRRLQLFGDLHRDMAKNPQDLSEILSMT